MLPATALGFLAGLSVGYLTTTHSALRPSHRERRATPQIYEKIREIRLIGIESIPSHIHEYIMLNQSRAYKTTLVVSFTGVSKLHAGDARRGRTQDSGKRLDRFPRQRLRSSGASVGTGARLNLDRQRAWSEAEAPCDSLPEGGGVQRGWGQSPWRGLIECEGGGRTDWSEFPQVYGLAKRCSIRCGQRSVGHCDGERVDADPRRVLVQANQLRHMGPW